MIKSYKIITTQFCHKCPAMKEFMSSQKKLPGEVVNASTPEGLEVAKKFQVVAVPTVVFLDDNGKMVKKVQEKGEVEEVLKSL
ncbi:TPA: hypothetical protein HA265_02575 [Candidatus Woesearchaeota archaeon]|nr:hypothetical protein [Candidatus Woesearchaeota archaeon]